MHSLNMAELHPQSQNSKRNIRQHDSMEEDEIVAEIQQVLLLSYDIEDLYPSEKRKHYIGFRRPGLS